MKRMILNLLWLAAIITAIELLTLHQDDDRQYEDWAHNYLEQEATDSIVNEEAHFSYVPIPEENETCQVCE